MTTQKIIKDGQVAAPQMSCGGCSGKLFTVFKALDKDAGLVLVCEGCKSENHISVSWTLSMRWEGTGGLCHM